MPHLNDLVFDSGLSHAQTNLTRMDINFTQEPTTYTEATSTFSCGNKTGLVTGAPQDGLVDGRMVIVPAITDGSVTATQTAGWWSGTNGVAIFEAAGALAATQAVTSGNVFTLDATDLTLRDAA